MHALHEIDTTDEAIAYLANLMEGVTPKVIEVFGGGENGIYIFFCGPRGNKFLHRKVCDPDQTNTLAESCEFSRRNALRLIAHPDHKLSWQSRKPNSSDGGGAVRLPSDYILSIAGFSEETNEALASSVARVMRWAGGTFIEESVALSRNFDHCENVHQIVLGIVMPTLMCR